MSSLLTNEKKVVLLVLLSHVISCPSCANIVTGIFPGRNPGITNSGNYFDIQANENYELLPDYSVYNSVESFP